MCSADAYQPHVIDAHHARRFVSPARLCVWAIEKERAGQHDQAARLLDAAKALVLSKKGSSLCLDCGKPQSEPGVPAICAAWHEKGSS